MSRSGRILRLLAVLLPLCAAPVLRAQPVRYASECLERLAGAVALPPFATSADTCRVAGSFRQYPLVAVQRGGVVTHIGIRIFSDEYKAAAGELLCNFVERYLLELLVEPDEASRNRRMMDDGVAIVGDLERIPVMGHANFCCDITSLNGRQWRLSWHDALTPVLSLSAPAQFELIMGKNKIELEQGISDEIRRHDESRSRPVDVLEAEPTGTGLYVCDRGCYLLEQMRAATYYKIADGGYRPVLEAARPVESLCNLLSLPECGAGYTLRIRQRKYGFRQDEFSCPLGRFVSFCREAGCVPYVGIEEEGIGRIVASLIMVNAEFGYNHILQVVFDPLQLRAGGGVISATLNAYTPTHNLENIYDDDEQNRPRDRRIKLNIP